MSERPTIHELEEILKRDDESRVLIYPDGSIGVKIQLLLDPANVNEIVLASMLDVLKKSKGAHYTNIEMRINGEDVQFEADWLKYLEFDESHFSPPTTETSHD